MKPLDDDRHRLTCLPRDFGGQANASEAGPLAQAIDRSRASRAIIALEYAAPYPAPASGSRR